ncbi:MAG TPA: hypothetical protein VNY83_09970 [Solirubrobacterales bacterium]|jgi:hypothetical protein|nr:hypothetical protein [Solirubrobacterales bacterium]
MSSQTHPPTRLRSSLANAALAVEERVVWSAGDAVRSAADAVKWPFERAAWAIERGLIWPLQERFADWDGALHAVAVAAVALAAVGAGVAGLLWVTPGGGGNSAAPQAAGGAAIAAKPSPHITPAQPAAPLLHGVAPVFAPAAGGGAAKVAGKEAVRARSSTGSAKGGGASTSSAAGLVGKPAGPAALGVARQFSDAFVLYETGQGGAPVRAAFGATATPALAHSLLRRPPRLPANVKVPKAKVLNVVAGPSSGGVYTVSVSLLRVGLTSELRLEMEKAKHGKWHVTEVLG